MNPNVAVLSPIPPQAGQEEQEISQGPSERSSPLRSFREDKSSAGLGVLGDLGVKIRDERGVVGPDAAGDA
jgi:hypothetical protein